MGSRKIKRSLGIPRNRWDYNVKMDVKEERCAGINVFVLAEDR
jgi:hypothetical protein